MRPTRDAAEWPPELDALVAAPQPHRLLLENDAVRVLDTRIAPGETVPLHTHRWPGRLYVIRWSDVVRRDAEERVVVDSRLGKPLAAETTVWTGPLPPHTLGERGNRGTARPERGSEERSLSPARAPAGAVQLSPLRDAAARNEPPQKNRPPAASCRRA